MKNWNWAVVLSISCAIGIVVVPILSERLPGMRARWALAQAANAADLNEGDPQALLDAAVKQLSEPESEVDFWHVRIKIALKKDGQQVLEVLRDAKDTDSFATIANAAIFKLAEKRDFKSAVAACTLLYEQRKSPPTTDELNQIAYFRSLCDEDLQSALEEINLALTRRPGDFQLLDTRAWVQYGLGFLPEALQDADAAVKLVDQMLEQEENSIWNSLNRMTSGKVEPQAADGILTQREAGALLWSAGVIHYHRGKILDGLGRTEPAELEWKWLRDRNLPCDDRLF